MTDKTVEYFYAVLSPFSYLGAPSLREICTRHDANLVYIPADFFEVFKVSGGVPVHQRATQRQAYRSTEMRRWADHRGMALNIHPKFFPADQTKASLMVLAAADLGQDPSDLSFAYQRAVWVEDRDIADTDTVIAIAGESGFDGKALWRSAQAEVMVAQYKANTDEAIARSMFGPPSYIFDDELFWGQDRLEFLDRALAAA